MDGNGQLDGEPKNNAENWAGNDGGPDEEPRSNESNNNRNNNRTNIYWKSTEAKKWFGFADYPGVDVVAGLEERIDLLKKVNSYKNGYKLVLPMVVEKGNNYVSNHKFTIRQKSLFLLKAYQIALDKMRVGVRWVDRMCHRALRELNSYGIKTAAHKEVVAKWNRDFRSSDKFPHPNPSVRMGKKATSVLFEVFPHLEARVQEFVLKHLH